MKPQLLGVREGVRPAGRAIEAAADGKDGVADFLGAQAGGASTARASALLGSIWAFLSCMGAAALVSLAGMIRRCIALTDQPLSMKRRAR